MYSLIENYIKKLTKEDITKFALKNNIIFNEEELDFTYNFIKKNYQIILNNPKLFNIDRYKDNYTKENFSKITKVYQEYLIKYSNYL